MKDQKNRAERIHIEFVSKHGCDILQELGEREDATISQKTITNEFAVISKKIEKANMPIMVRFHELRIMARQGLLKAGCSYRIIDYDVHPASGHFFTRMNPERIFDIVVTARNSYEIFDEARVEFSETNIASIVAETGLDITKFKINYSLYANYIKPNKIYELPPQVLSGILEHCPLIGRFDRFTVVYSPCGYLAVYFDGKYYDIAYEMEPVVPFTDIIYGQDDMLDPSQWRLYERGYSGIMSLGEIIWMRDDLGNEAPFDFYHLGWNPTAVENYMKDFMPEFISRIPPFSFFCLFPELMTIDRWRTKDVKIKDIPSFAMIVRGQDSVIYTGGGAFVVAEIYNSNIRVDKWLIADYVKNSNISLCEGNYGGICDSDIRYAVNFEVRNISNLIAYGRSGTSIKIDGLESSSIYFVDENGDVCLNGVMSFFVLDGDKKLKFVANQGASWLTWIPHCNNPYFSIQGDTPLYRGKALLTKEGIPTIVWMSIESSYVYIV